MTGYVNVLSVNVSFYHDDKCIVTKVVSFRYFFSSKTKLSNLHFDCHCSLVHYTNISEANVWIFFWWHWPLDEFYYVFQVKIIDWKDCFMNKRCFDNKSETLFWERFELFCSHCRLFKKPISAHFHFQFFFLKCHCFQCHLKKNPSSLGVCRLKCWQPPFSLD